MTAINRVDQALLLLKDRLRRMEKPGGASKAAGHAGAQGLRNDPLAALRPIAGRGGMEDGDLRRAVVCALLGDAFGEELTVSLAFQSVADEVTRILERDEHGRRLLEAVISDLVT